MKAPRDDIAAIYRRFAADEAHGHSPLYEAITSAIAEDASVLDLIATLPRPKWQPNLLLGAWKYAYGTAADYSAFRERLLHEPDAVLSVMHTHTTQTNEPARCAAILPFLSAIEGPIALFEVGTSAGLCLLPDRYHYRYRVDGRTIDVGPASTVELSCAYTGAGPVPSRIPDLAWRGGIDLNPLDVRDDETRRWLRALIWPEQTDRLLRLDAAMSIAREARMHIVAGDADAELDVALDAVPRDATLVIVNIATVAYFQQDARRRFGTRARRAATWISQEFADVLPDVVVPTAEARRGLFVLAVNGVAVGLTAPHGGTIHWFAA